MFGLFGGVQNGSKFSFGGRTWVRVSSKFNLSSSKQFEVCYIRVLMLNDDASLLFSDQINSTATEIPNTPAVPNFDM